jgi:3'(2'), 5'-bisphosphate nucleotidase
VARFLWENASCGLGELAQVRGFMSGFEKGLAIAKIVRESGMKARQMAQQGFEVNQKGPGDFVTDVDRALDRMLAGEFGNLFPRDIIITEENPDSQILYRDNPLERLWCIDPIDGTHDFIQTQRNYAVMVGLLENGQARAGWIYDPAEDTLFFGGRGWGLFRQQGDRVQDCFPQPPLHQHRVCIGANDRKNYAQTLQQVIPEIDLWERPGSFGLKIMDVVLGKAGMLIYFNQRVKLWDTIAPIALAEQAGLACCDLTGQPIQFSPLVIDIQSLAHRQAIIIGWKHCIDLFLPRLAQVIPAYSAVR